MTKKSRGFTLVEILIVVIILGILAAIVIPQFTNASTDAKNNSTSSTLQTLRGQIELFKIQHGDTPPASTALWTVLLGKTNVTDTTQVVATGTLAVTGCGDESTGGKRVVLHTRVTLAQDQAAGFVTPLGWTVVLSQILVATGSFYYYDAAAPALAVYRLQNTRTA